MERPQALILDPEFLHHTPHIASFICWGGLNVLDPRFLGCRIVGSRGSGLRGYIARGWEG